MTRADLGYQRNTRFAWNQGSVRVMDIVKLKTASLVSHNRQGFSWKGNMYTPSMHVCICVCVRLCMCACVLVFVLTTEDKTRGKVQPTEPLDGGGHSLSLERNRPATS